MTKPFYITTTLPYVNADPHIGFALEIVYADALARYARLAGQPVFFNTGTDEHGTKIHRKALEENKDPQAYVDEQAAKFDQLKTALNLSYDAFIRTTDPKHVAAAEGFWRHAVAAGDIYKKQYQTKYCVGCELEKTDSELVNGQCPIHPTYQIELIDEENYFFRFSKYQAKLLALYESQPEFVRSAGRLNEIKAFVARGLADFSISRLKTKMPWGVPVPGDEEQIMYVWFDALVSYISTLDWPQDETRLAEFWGAVGEPRAIQVAGKDNLRQQSAIWQAMLMSAGLPTSKQILIHGFINSGGQKMSKSIGNVVDPFSLVEEYGTDALRYFLLRELDFWEDSDYTAEKFKVAYNAHLANGLGNLTSRIMKMANTYLASTPALPDKNLPDNFKQAMEKFDVQGAMNIVWQEISSMDEEIQKTEPFKLIKTDKQKGEEIISNLVVRLDSVARMLEPLLPTTAVAIKEAVKNNSLPGVLFPRKD